MKNLNVEQMERINAEGNCRGTYEACIFAAGTAGAVGVLASAGFGIGLAVLAAGAAMEYCRQSYIGCVEDSVN